MLPLVGHVDATITALAPVVLHGDRYLDLAIEADGRRAAVRVPLHCFSRHPNVGDRVRLRSLLGQVDGVEFLGAGDGTPSP
jgi:hypothetical protein